jgi:hypothetical protein
MSEVIVGLTLDAAQTLAKDLARRVTFRWRVYLKVRKRLGFSVHGPTYRKWLKSLSAEELSVPVEDVHAGVTRRLDDRFSERSRAWGERPGHLSDALKVVEETYPEFLGALSDGDRDVLSERWTQSRSRSVRAQLLDLGGPWAALSTVDLAEALKKRSDARRAVRLQAFEVEPKDLKALFSQIPVPKVSADSVTVLVGDYGAGKSEAAEAWHREGIEALGNSEDAPLPVWLLARESTANALDHTLERVVGPLWRSARGLMIVLDGLDEVDPGSANHLLNSARELRLNREGAQILITARHGVAIPRDSETTVVSPLSAETAIEIVETIAGEKVVNWSWTEGMKESLARPFFALATGAMYRDGKRPKGEVDLLRSLVTEAFARPNEFESVTSAQVSAVLESLAVTLTRDNKEGLTVPDRQIALASRLVALGPDQALRFSLPIFQHWYAAQAILDGKVPTATLVESDTQFGKWRWATAVAVAIATDPRALDSLVAALVAGNAGAAGWILDEAFRGHAHFRTSDDADLDPVASGPRLLKALRTWEEGLGPLARGTLPARLLAGHVELGFFTFGHGISVAFARDSPVEDKVTGTPSVSPFAALSPEWVPWFTSGTVPPVEAWPWLITKEKVANETGGKLGRDPFLGSGKGVWAQERRYDLARSLVGKGNLWRGHLDADSVRREASRIIAQGFYHSYSFDSAREYAHQELVDLAAWIESSGVKEIRSLTPGHDLEHGQEGGPICRLYSRQALMSFEAEVHSLGCDAYDEAIEYHFQRLSWAMAGTARSPFGVALLIADPPAELVHTGNSLSSVRVPLSILEEVAQPTAHSVWGSSKRAVITPVPYDRQAGMELRLRADTLYREWLNGRDATFAGGISLTEFGATNLGEVRPASSVAADWLWNDLRRLGLANGTPPKFL